MNLRPEKKSFEGHLGLCSTNQSFCENSIYTSKVEKKACLETKHPRMSRINFNYNSSQRGSYYSLQKKWLLNLFINIINLLRTLLASTFLNIFLFTSFPHSQSFQNETLTRIQNWHDPKLPYTYSVKCFVVFCIISDFKNLPQFSHLDVTYHSSFDLIKQQVMHARRFKVDFGTTKEES